MSPEDIERWRDAADDNRKAHQERADLGPGVTEPDYEAIAEAQAFFRDGGHAEKVEAMGVEGW